MKPQTQKTPPDRTGLDIKAQSAGNRLQVHATHSTDAAQVPVVSGEAERFLALLDESAEAFCFRTFADSGDGTGRKYSGNLDTVAGDLRADNDKGRGVFVVINEGGQKDSDIVRIRAVFADFDKVPLPDHFEFEPHIIVESSRGKYHAYWLTDGLDVAQFKTLQKHIAARYGSDTSVCNPSRVMRVPGFIHRKPADSEGHDGEPFQTCIIHAAGGQPYAAQTVLEAFPPASKAPAPPTASQTGAGPVQVSSGRHDDMLKLSGKLARQIHYERMSRDAALAALDVEAKRGRWSRDMRPGEMTEALDGALNHLADGTWPNDRGEEHEPEPEQCMHLIELAGLSTATVEPPQFVMPPLLPRGHVTLLGAHGGAGKSTFALELAAHVAAGRPFGPFECKQGRALVVSLEDAGDLVRFRLARICETFGLDMDTIAERLTLLDGATVDAALAVEHSLYGVKQLSTTAALTQLQSMAAGHDLIVIDNASDGFAGNGNDALQVRQFMKRMLGGIAHENNAAVLLLAHLDKAAARHGSQGQSFIGSVAWHNSARSRLALIEHEGQLALHHEKANLSRKAEPLPLRWNEGVLVPAVGPQGAGQDSDAIGKRTCKPCLRRCRRHTTAKRASRWHVQAQALPGTSWKPSGWQKHCAENAARIGSGWQSST